MAASLPEADLFDALRNRWHQGNTAPAVDLIGLRAAAETELQQVQHRHRRATIGMSLSFAAAMAVTTWVFLHYDDHGPLFYGAIVAVNLLMIFMGALMWLGVQHERSSANLSSLAHIERSLRKLRFQRFTRVYALPIYMVLLLAALFCYYADLLAAASAVFKLVVYGGTLLYVGGVWLVSHRKNKKRMAEAERLLADLQKFKAALREG